MSDVRERRARARGEVVPAEQPQRHGVRVAGQGASEDRIQRDAVPRGDAQRSELRDLLLREVRSAHAVARGASGATRIRWSPPMSRFQAPRGMRDLPPEIAAAFDVAAASIAGRAVRYGYARLETPAIEDTQVFVRSSGETGDGRSKEMDQAMLHGEGGLALRPEGTAPVARAYLEHGMHRLPQPVRLFYLEAMWRGQRPQLGRWRQFWQWGLECFGSAEAVADVEIIEFSDSSFRELGLTEYELELNTIGDAKCRAKVRDGLRAYFEPFRDRLSDDSRRRLDTNVLRVLDSKEERDQEVVKGAPRIVELLCAEDVAHFDAVKSGLERLGVSFVVNDRLVRGLDYYTRTVFEFILTNDRFKGRRLSVAGGGRYHGLVQTLGGPPPPRPRVARGRDVMRPALDGPG